MSSRLPRPARPGTPRLDLHEDDARAVGGDDVQLAEARAELAERGGGILLANITAFESVWVELWAGDPVAAAEFGAEGFRLHEGLGAPGFLSHAAGTLALAIYALDRDPQPGEILGREGQLPAFDQPSDPP